MTFCVVALTGFSDYFRSSDPQRALSLDPLSVDATTDVLIGVLSGSNQNAQLADLEQLARRAIRFTPVHARVRGLYGEVLNSQGDRETADAVFNSALSLSQTETTSLQRTLRTAAERGESTEALAKLDILFRRWPAQFSNFAPIIPFLLSLPGGYDAALSALEQSPPWRSRFLGYLNSDPNTVDLAYRLQLDLNSDNPQADPAETAGTLRALLRDKKYDFAYRLFLLTLNDNDRSHYGYVFNSDFDLEPSGRPFDWTLRSQPGVRIARDSRVTSKGSDSTFEVQFLGKPVKRIGLNQHLFLPPGQYELTVDLDVSNLKTPKGLFIDITCLDPRRTVSRLDIPTGSYRDRILKSEFTLPDSSCRMLRIGMGTDLIAESFRYRYSGTVTIRSISVTKTASS